MAKRFDTTGNKAGQFILASRTFELRAPSSWNDTDAEDFLALMENADVWAKMEEVLQAHLRDAQKHTPKVEDVIIRVKE